MEKRRGVKHGGIIKNFRRNCFVTSVENVRRGSFSASLISGIEKCQVYERGDQTFPSKIFLSVPEKIRREKNFVGEHFSVSLISGIEKSYL